MICPISSSVAFLSQADEEAPWAVFDLQIGLCYKKRAAVFPMPIQKKQHNSYVLITAAYNEEKQIEQTIKSVLQQKILPKRWIIISDGSTDKTDSIIKNYASRYPFIIYDRQEKIQSSNSIIDQTSYAKARVMNRAIHHLKNINYDFIGNLDADITFGPEYYESIIEKMNANTRLGIAGGGAYNILKDGTLSRGGFIQPDFVGGPVQFLRIGCFKDIDRYPSYGHDDVLTTCIARMKGWEVRCFPEIRAYHHGMPGNSIREKVPICFRMGQMDYIMGALYLFMIGRCLIRMFQKPYVLAGLSMFAGFCWAAIKKKKSRIPEDLKRFLRTDQKRKIKESFRLGL
jgi:biofilm PGA synthesis N-glycosyltransferase PgaC